MTCATIPNFRRANSISPSHTASPTPSLLSTPKTHTPFVLTLKPLQFFHLYSFFVAGEKAYRRAVTVALRTTSTNLTSETLKKGRVRVRTEHPPAMPLL